MKAKGMTKLRFKNMIVEAWNLTFGLKWPIFRRLIYVAFIGLLLLIPKIVLSIHTHSPTYFDRGLDIITTLIVLMITLTLWSPIFIMGVRRAVGLSIELRPIISECLQVKKRLFGLIMIYVSLTFIINYTISLLSKFDGHSYSMGFIAIICYKTIFYLISLPILFFSLPLIVIQKQSVYCALVNAYKKMQLYWKEFLGSFFLISYIPLIIVAGLLFLSYKSGAMILFIPIIALFLIAQIWLIPMAYTIGGILFREAFGLKIKGKLPSDPALNSTDPGVFY